MSCCQIFVFRVVHVVLALKASRQDLVVAGCPVWDNIIELREACFTQGVYQLKEWLVR